MPDDTTKVIFSKRRRDEIPVLFLWVQYRCMEFSKEMRVNFGGYLNLGAIRHFTGRNVDCRWSELLFFLLDRGSD